MNKLFLGLAALILAAIVTLPIVFAKGGETIPDTNRPTPVKAVTLFDTVISNETSTATSPHEIEVPVASIAVFQVTSVASAAGTSNVVFSFNASVDRLGYTTTFPYTATVALNGTNPVISVMALGTNILARSISFDRVATTQTNFVTLSAASITFLPAP